MQRTGQLHKDGIIGRVAQVIVGLVLFVLVIGLWVFLWVPL